MSANLMPVPMQPGGADAQAMLLQLLGPLRRLVEDPEVTDVLVDGDGTVRVSRLGEARREERTVVPARRDLEALVRLVQRQAGEIGAELPAVGLPGGARIQVLRADTAWNGQGPWVAIRCLRRARFDARGVVASGMLPAAVLADLVTLLVAERRNIVLCGPAGSGKTTLAQVLLHALPPEERLFLLQDVEEIVPPDGPSAWGSFRPGVGGYGPLLASALRMCPDRIAVGECRGPETWALLDALACGHEGGVTTVHARTGEQALARLESLALQDPRAPEPRTVRARVADAVGVLVVLERPGSAGERRLSAVTTVEGLGADGSFLLRPRWRPAAACV